MAKLTSGKITYISKAGHIRENGVSVNFSAKANRWGVTKVMTPEESEKQNRKNERKKLLKEKRLSTMQIVSEGPSFTRLGDEFLFIHVLGTPKYQTVWSYDLLKGWNVFDGNPIPYHGETIYAAYKDTQNEWYSKITHYKA